MADITLLHWNLETFSTKKLNNGNGAAMINYIARVVRLAGVNGANIVSLIELKNSAVDAIMAQLLPALDIAFGVPGANQWRSINVNSRKNNEAYVVLYRTGQGFTALAPYGAGLGAEPISGLTNQTLVGTDPGGNLPFNSSLTKTGGRTPYYVTFRTDTFRNFSVVAYHTMFGYWRGRGVRNVGLLAQSRAVVDAGDTIEMDASFTSGDFNVDFDQATPGEYANLLALPATQSTNERTSLVNSTPPNGYPNSTDYRANAYDNIFRYRRFGGPPGGLGVVADLINASTTIPTGSGLLVPEATAFQRLPIPLGHLIQNIPPTDFEDAWHIVRHAVSNHLPVYVTMTI